MGVTKQALKMFLHESEHRLWEGELITFGKQTVGISNDTVLELFRKYGLEVEPEKVTGKEFRDSQTRHSDQTIEDAQLFKLIGNINYNCMDVSDYEGANIIHNLNYPIDETLEGRFDIVYTGGCLDNVFNPVSLLINSTKLLKSGGRVFHYESFKGLIGAYLYFSPEWFYSYYAVNDFRDVKVYVCHQTQKGHNRFDYDTDIYLWKPDFTRQLDFDYFEAATNAQGILYCMVVAEKGESSTSEVMPIQLQYINSSNCKNWREYRGLDRPLLKGHRNTPSPTLFNSDHFTYCGSFY